MIQESHNNLCIYAGRAGDKVNLIVLANSWVTLISMSNVNAPPKILKESVTHLIPIKVADTDEETGRTDDIPKDSPKALIEIVNHDNPTRPQQYHMMMLD